MDKNSLLVLISAFVLIIIGTSLIDPVSTEEQLRTQTIRVVNETIDITAARGVTAADGGVQETVNLTITNAPTGWKQQDCVITGFVYRNQSGGTMTLATHYYFSTFDGKLQLISQADINASDITNANITAGDYSYCSDGYLKSTWARTVMNLVPGFFALALLGAGLLLFFYVAKKEGFLNWHI